MAGVVLTHRPDIRARGTQGLARRRDDRSAHNEERDRGSDEPGHLNVSIRDVARSPRRVDY
jgi:hypothetical protein